MANLDKIVLSLMFGSLFFSAKTQNFPDCDYLRELKVNKIEGSQGDFNKNALCFVKYNNFKEPVDFELKNSFDNGDMNVYFPNNCAELSKNDLIDLNRYISEVLVPYGKENKIKNINIEGYANVLGDEEYNYFLSIRRAENVAKVIKHKLYCYFPYDIQVKVSAFGESKSVETDDSIQLQNDRKVIISVEENPLKRGLEYLGGNVFLLDQSGSMNDGSWNSLREYFFPEAKAYYSFSQPFIINGSSKEDYPEFNYSYDINTDVPAGKTSFYGAMDKLISSPFVGNNDTLTTIINGEDNVGLISPLEIIEKAKDKNVILNILGINVREDYAKTLINFTNKTKGNYYFITNSYSSKNTQ